MNFHDFYVKLLAQGNHCCKRGHDFSQVEAVVAQCREQGCTGFFLNSGRMKLFLTSLRAKCDCQVLKDLSPFVEPELEKSWDFCFAETQPDPKAEKSAILSFLQVLEESKLQFNEELVSKTEPDVNPDPDLADLPPELAIVYKLAVRSKSENIRLEE